MCGCVCMSVCVPHKAEWEKVMDLLDLSIRGQSLGTNKMAGRLGDTQKDEAEVKACDPELF